MLSQIKKIWNEFIFFNQASTILQIGQKRIVREADFIELPNELKSFGEKIEHAKVDHLPTTEFLKEMFRITFPFWKWGIVIDLLSLFFTFVTAPLMHQLISLLSSGIKSDADFIRAVVLGLSLGLTGIIGGMLAPMNFYHFLRTYIVINLGLGRKLFRKAMKRLNANMDSQKSGDIFNHISQDVDAVSNLPLYSSEALVTFFSILIASSMLFHYVGFAAFAAIFVIIALIPLSHFISKNYQKRNLQISSQLDQRMSLLSQTVNAIRLVKFYAWELAIENKILGIRNEEMKIRIELAQFELITTLVYFMSSSLTLLVSLFFYVKMGGELNPAIVFAMITLIDQLSGPLSHTPYIISALSEAKVAADRLCQYLQGQNLDELIKQFIFHENEQSQNAVNSNTVLQIQNLAVQFDQTDSPFIKNFNLDVKNGESIAIIGPVAAGKSTLIKSIIGEVPITQGRIQFAASIPVNKISYVQQDPFILNESIENNMTLKSEHVDHVRLNEVIQSACLAYDLAQFPAGLNTEIGEKGVNLSGGQKQRVSLARAAYHDSELILLDDPLSAVDHETEKQIIDRLIFGYWQNKTRLVVTHRLEYLEKFDRILFMENGQILAEGTFSELMNQHPRFQEFLLDHQKTQHSDKVAETVSQLEKTTQQTKQDFITKEDQEVGAVQFSVYWQYFQSLAGNKMPGLMIFLLCSVIVLWCLAPLYQTYWLGTASANYPDQPMYVLKMFSLLSFLTMLSFIGGMYFWMRRSLRAGYDLHSQMLRGVLSSPIAFFDTTPLGRILHRFSRDMNAIDSSLYRRFSTMLECLVQIAISIFLVIGLLPPVIVFVVPVFWLYYRIQKNYRASAREVKRIDSVLRSPKAAFFKESVSGLITIRSFAVQNRFFDLYLEKLHRSQRAFFNNVILNRWFSVRMPLISGFISIATAVFIAIGVREGWLSAAISGLLLTTCIGLWRNMNQAIRMFADIESVMTSVERIKHYTDLPAEPIVTRPAVREDILNNWPVKGEIEFRNASLRYLSNLPWILKDLNLIIPAQKRIGLIGRTGSGKSTLLQALYRFIPTEEGSILIDGIDIASVPLPKLRQSLAIIPQDPILFKGQLRDNLDQDGIFSDDKMLEILNAVEFTETLQAQNSQDQILNILNFSISENGQNLSQGQRQLICLARALLLNNKIIILDEATSSLDVQTDQKIQRVLNSYCTERTVIIIAHRLGTLKDCQHLIIVENGQARLASNDEDQLELTT